MRNPADTTSVGFHQNTLGKGFYLRLGKRMFDFIFSAAGLIILTPLFVVVAIFIKLTSRGPVFFRQMRVGKDGHSFDIVKFRSMTCIASAMPPGITVRGDHRITPVGNVLRRYKIDELPQLWNVFRGEMSLVGPRPELLKYVEDYSPEQRLVLSVRPGITDPASLLYRHEAEMLSRYEDPEQAYRLHILPDKLAQNLRYIRDISFRSDLHIIFATVCRSFLYSASSPP
jgi:lipopolysaccharide/colanic/teichoic acid biosynthesis glycosyltransferase